MSLRHGPARQAGRLGGLLGAVLGLVVVQPGQLHAAEPAPITPIDIPVPVAGALIANGVSQTAVGDFTGFQVLGGGTITTTGPVTITTTGTGISGTTLGAVNLVDPTSVTAATGIILNNALLTAPAPVTITTTGTSVTMSNGSMADIVGGGTITSNGTVLNTTGTGTQFSGQNLNLVSNATSQVYAVTAASGSSVVLSGGSILQSGPSGANTVNADGLGTFLSLSNLSITTISDTTTPAAVAVNNLATGQLDGVTIVTFPGASEAVATQTGGTLTVTNSNLTTNGNANPEGQAGSGAVGARAFGTNATTGAPSTINLLNTNITTNGTLASGVESDDGGVISMVGGSITTNSPMAQGVVTTANTPATASLVGQVSLTGVTVTSVGDSIASFGGVSTISVTGSTVTSTGSGIALNVAQNPTGAIPANTTVIFDSSTVTGAMLTDAVSTSTVTVQNGTLWTMTGNSNLTNLTNAASTINFTPPVADPTQLASYKTLTAMNYVGANGTLGLNTFLGADGSPSDRLVVGGTASGLSFLDIMNTTGLGALTTGAGILVVDALPGANTDDAFRLAGPVIAGPYEYTLFKGNDNPEAWYLRSRLDCALPGAPSPPCPPPPLPPTPPGLVPPQPVIPNFRQEVSLYAAVPALSMLYGRALLDTMHERIGGEANLGNGTDLVTTTIAGGAATAYGDGSGRTPRAAPYPEAVPLSYANGAWGRVFAQHGERDGDRAGIFGDGPKYDYDFMAIQAGADLLRWQEPGGLRTRAGLYGALGDVHSDVTHFDGRLAGRNSFAAYSIGGYWTWFGREGWYLDSVAQGTWYDVKAQSTRIPALETDGWGFGGSLEGGYPFRLAGGWFVEPQAQLVYQTVDLGDASDIGAKVRFGDADSLAGRVGVRFITSWLMPGPAGPSPVMAWVRPSYWHEFLGDPDTLFSSETGFIPFRADLGEPWVEINTGIAARLDRHTALYATATYDVGIEGRSEVWDGKIGLRVNW